MNYVATAHVGKKAALEIESTVSWVRSTYAALLQMGSQPCKDPRATEQQYAEAALAAHASSFSLGGPWASIDDTVLPRPDGLPLDSCDFPQRGPDFDSSSFLDDFISLNRPVIVRAAALAGGSPTLDQAWSQKLSQNFSATTNFTK